MKCLFDSWMSPREGKSIYFIECFKELIISIWALDLSTRKHMEFNLMLSIGEIQIWEEHLKYFYNTLKSLYKTVVWRVLEHCQMMPCEENMKCSFLPILENCPLISAGVAITLDIRAKVGPLFSFDFFNQGTYVLLLMDNKNLFFLARKKVSWDVKFAHTHDFGLSYQYSMWLQAV